MTEEINNTASPDADESQPQELTIQEKLAAAGVRHRPLDTEHSEMTRKLQEHGIRHRAVPDAD